MSRARFLILWNCFLWVLVDCHQEVLRGINLKLFDQVLQWAQESLSAIRAVAKPCHAEVQQPYPLLTDVICRRIPTAFVLTSECSPLGMDNLNFSNVQK